MSDPANPAPVEPNNTTEGASNDTGSQQTPAPEVPKNSLFRTVYRDLSEEEAALIQEIKLKAAELEALVERAVVLKGAPTRYAALAITSLETSVMWIVKHITG